MNYQWRWVDEKGRAMTAWRQVTPPPIGEVSDEKGTMRVEVRQIDAMTDCGHSRFDACFNCEEDNEP